jgi:ABC-type polysaccharide/polyol phosphate transport system ATPase subunit
VPAVVSFVDVSKRFTIYQRDTSGLKDSLLARLSGQRRQRRDLWALRDVSLDIERGDTLALIGANGSGKSTLLQMLAGIHEPDGGRVDVRGRVTSLLELGAGFAPDLSGRDNVYLNASLHGVSRREVDRRFDAIVSFAELEAFIDTPVRNYSSGMYMRLGFAVAVHLDPEILLIDEAFAVGDESFQRKCLRQVREFHRQGVTIVLVSHDLTLAQQLCERAALLREGQLEAVGRTSEVVARYHELAAAELGTSEHRRWGTRDVEITRVELLDRDGLVASSFRTRDRVTIRLHYDAVRPVPGPVFGLAIYRDDDVHVTGPNTRMSGFDVSAVDGPGALDYTIERLPLLPGRYLISASVYDHDLIVPYDHRDRFMSLLVLEGGTGEQFGVVEFPATWGHAS